jgi:hypothetical protein
MSASIYNAAAFLLSYDRSPSDRSSAGGSGDFEASSISEARADSHAFAPPFKLKGFAQLFKIFVEGERESDGQVGLSR